MLSVFMSMALATGDAQPARICETAVQRQGSTVRFCGPLEFANVAKAIDAMGSGVTALAVTSPGGNPVAAIRLAEAANKRNLEIRIERACLSGCAHYLLAGGDHVTVAPGAAIGFHHTPTYILGALMARKQPDPERLVDAAAAEQSFYSKQGVDRALLIEPELALEPRCVGLGGTPPRSFVVTRMTFFVPTKAELERYRGGKALGGYWPSSAAEAGKNYERALPVGPSRTFRFGRPAFSKPQIASFAQPPLCEGGAP